VQRYNSDLANDLGNLVSRATTLIATHGKRAAGTPGRAGTPDADIARALAHARAAVAEAMAEFQFHRALAGIWEFIGVLNRYVDGTQPWALARDPAQRDQLVDVLVTLAEALRALGVLLLPFVPEAAARLRAATGDAEAPTLAAVALGRPGRALVDVGAVQRLPGLFPRVAVDRGEAPASAAAAPAAPAAREPAAPVARITIEEFKRLDLRVAEVAAAEPVPKSKKLLKLTVRLDDETRTLVAGIAEHYRPEALVGRKVIVVANLEPATLMGVTSNGMVLAGSAGDTLALLALDRDLPPGAKVR
jgi:methionyl-tRNA synthetase